MTRKRNIESEIPVSQGSAAVPVRRKASGRTRSKHVPAPAETSVASEIPAPLPQAAEPVITELNIAVEIAYQPAREEIAELAYLYWEARGCQGGSAEEDWLRAEQELLSRTRHATA